MRNLALAALAAAIVAVCPAPAFAAALTTSGADTLGGVQGNLVTTNDYVRLKISGAQFATVKWKVVTAGSATVTTQYSKDEETNWLTPPYSTRIDAVSANPSTTPWSNNSPVAGTYEQPLPANATFFQVLCGNTGTATTIFIYGGQPYFRGTEVKATLYDVTEGSTGTGIPAVVFDLTGWNTTTINFAVPTTQVWTARFLDSTGASVVPGITTTAAGSSVLNITPDGPSLATLTLASNSINSIGSVWPRISLTLPAGGTVSTGRAVVTVRR